VEWGSGGKDICRSKPETGCRPKPETGDWPVEVELAERSDIRVVSELAAGS
jgi:hypothetical protein